MNNDMDLLKFVDDIKIFELIDVYIENNVDSLWPMSLY